MIIPPGQAVHENLDTCFTDLDELLAKLKTNSFTGYVRVSFWEYEGTLLCDHGDIVNAIQESKEGRKTGAVAASSIMAKAKSKDGMVSVYTLAPEMVTMVATVVESEPLHKELSSEYTSLDKLIVKLECEHHTGYVEVTLAGHQGTGQVFLQMGDPIETLLSTDGTLASGNRALPRLMEMAANSGATFNVYGARIDKAVDASSAIQTGMAFPQLLKVWQEILAAVERATDQSLGQGHFVDAFQDTLAEQDKAEAYPFLDPFAAEFDYANGQITYTGGPVSNFSQGLGHCLQATITRLQVEKRAGDFNARFIAALQDVMQKQAAAIQEFGLEAVLSELVS
jgi:hypothetical protein